MDFSLTPSLIIGVYVWWTHNGAYLQTALGSLCHVVFFSIRFDQAIIDSLIAFNYEVNGFSLPCKLALSVLAAIKEVNKLDYWVHRHHYHLIQAHMNKCRDNSSMLSTLHHTMRILIRMFLWGCLHFQASSVASLHLGKTLSYYI